VLPLPTEKNFKFENRGLTVPLNMYFRLS